MKLIQLPVIDFEQKLKQEIEENPALEDGKELPQTTNLVKMKILILKNISMMMKYKITN